MFEENENLVEESTENVELTTEEIVEGGEESGAIEPVQEEPQEAVETFTKEQVDEMIAKKLARKEAKIRREYENKYSRLETVVNTGLGTSDIQEATEKLETFYEKKGIPIPKRPEYSERETELLANGEAEDIIDAGFEEVVEEVERLASIGVENMSARDKIIFQRLATYRQAEQQERDLRSIGVSKDEIESEEFKEFANKLNPSLPLKEKYEMYSQMKPKKQLKQIGSVKSGMASQVKDHYSPDEIARMTDEELDDPKVWEAVRKSMTGQS
jgi:hypothetical protein